MKKYDRQSQIGSSPQEGVKIKDDTIFETTTQVWCGDTYIDHIDSTQKYDHMSNEIGTLVVWGM